MYDILTLNAMKVAELKSVAENLGISNAEKLKKQDLVLTIMDRQTLSAAPAESPAPVAVEAKETNSSNENSESSDRQKKTRERKPYKAEKEEVPAKEELAIDIPTEKNEEPAPEAAPAPEKKPEIPFLVLAKKDGQPRPQHPNQKNQRPEHKDRPERQDRPERTDRPERPNKPEQQEGQAERDQNIVRPDRQRRGMPDEHGYNFDGLVMAEGVKPVPSVPQ